MVECVLVHNQQSMVLLISPLSEQIQQVRINNVGCLIFSHTNSNSSAETAGSTLKNKTISHLFHCYNSSQSHQHIPLDLSQHLTDQYLYCSSSISCTLQQGLDFNSFSQLSAMHQKTACLGVPSSSSSDMETPLLSEIFFDFSLTIRLSVSKLGNIRILMTLFIYLLSSVLLFRVVIEKNYKTIVKENFSPLSWHPLHPFS